MKKNFIIIILGFVALILISTSVYFYFIPPSNMETHEQWGSFGSYIGGILTPITVLAALLTLIQSNNAHHSEMERLINQGQKVDLLRFIEKIESDIEDTLKQLTVNINLPDTSVNHPGSDVLLKISMIEWEKVIPTKDEVMTRTDKEEGYGRYDQKILSYEVFGMVAAYLNRLRDHCKAYDRAAGNNVTSLYFSRKYKVATQRLNAKGYDIDVWDLSDQTH